MDESEIYQRLGQLVRRHRERLRLNQADLAKAIGLSRASVANIETGRQHIPMHHLFSLARALKVDVHALLPSSNGASAAPLEDREIQSSIKLTEREQEEVAKVVGLIGSGRKRGTE